MADTANLGFELLEVGQSNAEVAFNENTNLADAVIGLSVIDQVTNDPPASPSEGDRYIVASSPTGDWATHADDLAYFNSGWKFATPKAGWTLWDQLNTHLYVHNGTAFIKVPSNVGYAITPLDQTISSPPTQAEVQAISDKVDAVLQALRDSGILNV